MSTPVPVEVFVEPTRNPEEPDAHRVKCRIGVQMFQIGRTDCASKEHAEWFGLMFIKALRNAAPDITVRSDIDSKRADEVRAP